jgi:type IV pilus assembly protein PilE
LIPGRKNKQGKSSVTHTNVQALAGGFQAGKFAGQRGFYRAGRAAKLRSQGGFTLIELMIVVAIVSILIMVVLPGYQNQVMRGHRSAAKAEMLEIANRQQQFLLANRTYTSNLSQLGGYSLPTAVAANYTPSIALGAGAVPSYTITFTAKGNQASDGNLALTDQGVKTPADKWAR